MNHKTLYDAAIIGAGPAGLFAAHRILTKAPNLKVLMLEKGRSFSERICIADCVKCSHTDMCEVLCGVGGSGMFSDGKLVCDLHSGGELDRISNLTDQEQTTFIHDILDTIAKFDGDSVASPMVSEDQKNKWKSNLKSHNLSIKFYDVTHMGTYNLRHITQNFVSFLTKHMGLSLITDCLVVDVVKNCKTQINTIYTANNNQFFAKNVIFSVGKTGSSWLSELFDRNDICHYKTKSYLGIRLETFQSNISELFQLSFDPKIWSFCNNKKVKTHCFCRDGDVIFSNYMGFPIVGGQTFYTEKNNQLNDSSDSTRKRSNFNILVSVNYGKEKLLEILNQFKQINPKGVVVQRLEDFFQSKTSTSFDVLSPSLKSHGRSGNIRKILDDYAEIGTEIEKFIMLLAQIFPGVANADNLIYAPSIEWFMDTVQVSPYMETAQTSWFATGDGAGLSQGIVHAATTGIIAADEICVRCQNNDYNDKKP